METNRPLPFDHDKLKFLTGMTSKQHDAEPKGLQRRHAMESFQFLSLRKSLLNAKLSNKTTVKGCDLDMSSQGVRGDERSTIKGFKVHEKDPELAFL